MLFRSRKPDLVDIRPHFHGLPRRAAIFGFVASCRTADEAVLFIDEADSVRNPFGILRHDSLRPRFTAVLGLGDVTARVRGRRIVAHDRGVADAR